MLFCGLKGIYIIYYFEFSIYSIFLRALQFTLHFIKEMVREIREDKMDESVAHIVEDAYDKILKRHHNWLVQNVFKVTSLIFFIPYYLLKVVCYISSGFDQSFSFPIRFH